MKHYIYVLKTFHEDKHVDLLLIGEGEKKHYVFIKDFNTLCMIIHYIVEENIFVFIVCKLLEKQKN